MYRVLIVEDDAGIAEAIREQLEIYGMQAHCVTSFRQVLSDFAEFQPHLILLDIKLPFFHGYHWCGEIRKVSQVPIIFISSASDSMNIVTAMSMGADDFIAKPFDQNVLMAKVQALLRRAYDFAASVSVIEHRGAMLNTEDGTLTCQGEKISLTKNEFRILLTLMRAKGRIVSRERLMEALWETDDFVDEAALTVNVGRLRKKLDAAGLNDFIATKHGVGYIIGG